MKLNKREVICYIMALVGFLCLASVSWAQIKESQLASKRYVDPKGYFKIVPPAGWRVKEYPQDPRGKVAFIAPDGGDYLRILVNVVDFNSIDELVMSCKDIENRIGIPTNIQKTDFGGSPAVRRSFEAKGQKFLAYDFLVGSVDHNLQFAAPPHVYQKYLSIVSKSMETYEPVEKSTSEKDFIAHKVAKKLRLAQLAIDNSNYELALDYIKEGLEFSPKNPELLKLKKEVENRR